MMSSTGGNGSKRGGGDSPTSSTKKRAKVEFDYDSKFIASSQEDLEIGLLRVQNRRLAERIFQSQRAEADWKLRIEQMEKKQMNSDTKMYTLNRQWNLLNEDIRLLLERFDFNANELDDDPPQRRIRGTGLDIEEEEEDIDNDRSPEEESNNFMNDGMKNRVMLTTRIVEKLLQVFGRMQGKYEKLSVQIRNAIRLDCPELGLSDVEGDEALERRIDQQLQPRSPEGQSPKQRGSNSWRMRAQALANLNEQMVNDVKRLSREVTQLHERHHLTTSNHLKLKDEVEQYKDENEELKSRLDALEFELNKSRTREQRMEDHFFEAREKLRDMQCGAASGVNSGSDNGTLPAGSKLEDLKRELDENKELANSRLIELDALNVKHKELLKEREKLKMDLKCIPDSVIHESAEYKSLQSHFSVLFNESEQLKTQLGEAKTQLITVKNEHLRQIELMESEELAMQKKLRNECMQLDDSLLQVKKEYEMLRIEFEQTLAANEQTGPINREMRHLITSLQNQSLQLKGENNRVKKKLKETFAEVVRLRQICEDYGIKVAIGGYVVPDSKVTNDPKDESVKEVKVEEDYEDFVSGNGGQLVIVTQTETDEKTCDSKKEIKVEEDSVSTRKETNRSSPLGTAGDTEGTDTNTGSASCPATLTEYETIVRELRAQLKKAIESKNDIKLLLDMFKSVDRDKRDKAQLMADVKRYRSECENKERKIRSLEEERRSAKTKFENEEYMKKITKYEELISQLQKKITNKMSEEEALLNEMEVTGQAFEDMQDQNIRLMQQLREKDDANFKLISERIQTNQITKLLKEEKEQLTEQILMIKNQLEATNQVVRKLEEKERILITNVSTYEKELSVRQQSMDILKRKTIESTQQYADLKLRLEKYLTQIRDAQELVADKTSAFQQEVYKSKRLHEEVAKYKSKYERAKKFEIASTADEVLQEEIRELREELTCPSCKTKRKDAVLNKCFHVFCYDCLKTRYETRQRKCPKCNQSFSAHDFHRLYLA